MNFFKNNLGWILVIILSLIPAFLWFGMLPVQYRFGGTTQIFTSLGQLTGLVGITLFALSLILSGRFKFFDENLHGLNRVYINHHRIGAIAFILLLFHPIFLTYRLIIFSLKIASNFWLPDSNWALNFGSISLFGMIILLILTFFVSLKYNVWKKTHKFMGLAFFFGGLHAFFINSDISRNIALRWYVLSLSAVGIFVYLYRTVFGKFFVKKYNYVLDGVKRLNNNVIQINLNPLDKKDAFNYSAGQFAFLSFKNNLISEEWHPFSFISIPKDGNVKFAIKNLGDYTSMLAGLPTGTMVEIEGPFGQFSFQNFPSKKQIWIAGGIGITPFISMAKNFSEEKNNYYNIDLYYSVKTESDLVLMDDLLKISEMNNNFRFFPFISEKMGNINIKYITQNSGDLKNKEILLCGPMPMVSSLKKQFKTIGVKKNNIHSEEFNL